MYLRSLECLCIALCFLGVRCQRGWGSNVGYNSGYSNSWNSAFPSSNYVNSGMNKQNAFGNMFGNSFSNTKPSRGSGSNIGPWESSSLNSNRAPYEGIYSPDREKNPNWGYEGSSNGEKQNSGNWQSDIFNVRPTEGIPSFATETSTSSQWNANSNKFFSNSNNDGVFSSWGSGRPFGANQGQSLRPENWNSNSNTNNNANEINTDTDYEDNSEISMWNLKNKKTPKPTFNSPAGSGKWETTTERRNKNTRPSKWESNFYNKPEKPSGNTNSNTSLKPGKNKNITSSNSNQQTGGKPSTLDTSILDELDKNDWYFGKESDYPKPPFRSTLNIDVSELWNFGKNNKNTKQNYRGNGSNKNNRRNRQTLRSGDIPEGIECECVSVTSCDEEDMIITQQDIKFDPRGLEAFRCEDPTEVCCTNPKILVSNRANFNEEKITLQCGQRRILEKNPFGESRGVPMIGDPNPSQRSEKTQESLINIRQLRWMAEKSSFADVSKNIVQPGEFPWMLTLENSQDNCSASLIHHKLALTAAHCTTGAVPNELVLRAGVWNSNEEPPQTRRVSRIIPHPEYNSQTPRNDIALLVVEEPFELTENVNSVCLPVTNDKWDSNECVVAGWRPKEIGGQVLKVLEKGTVNFLPQAECQNIMLVTDLWRNYVFHDSFMCGLEKTGRQSCTGDEGGFVVCPSKKQPNSYLQIGIVSRGMNCDKFGRPGIFTNVLKFLDWVNRNYFELGLFDDIDIRSL